MPRPLWSGSLTFGLVSVPVHLETATRSHRQGFHLLHQADHARLQRRMFCPEHKKYVHPEHMLRGYEVEPDKYVIVWESELESLAPDRSENIEIAQFVDVGEIDPLYYDQPYYLAPTSVAKPYQLLVQAMAETNKAGIAKFVMHGRERLVAVRSIDGALCLLMLHFSDDILPAGEVAPAKAKPAAGDLKVMKQAIDELSGDFDLGLFSDAYQEKVDKLIRQKKKAGKVVKAPVTEEGELEESQEEGEPVDLVAALEQSLEHARKKGS